VKNHRSQSGQALVAATFGLVALLAAAGLAIDMGFLRYQRRLQQSAADSAALAGAAEMASGNATFAATEDSKLNGFDNTAPGVTVNVNPAFPFGAATGVQVQVSVSQPTFFMRIFGINNATVSTVAVAINTSARNCVYALNGGAGITNNGTVNANGCGIVDDQNLHNRGGITASSVAVHGTASGRGTIPGAITGIVEAADPLFRLVPPPSGGCIADPMIQGNGGGTINPAFNPGTYCGFTVTGNKNVPLNSGTFVIGAGGLNFNGTGTISGNHVTFYMQPRGGAVSINTTGPSNQTLSLTAPATGALAGILFYQDPGNTNNATIDAKGLGTLQGAMYFPNALLNLSNTTNSAAYAMAVAKTLTLGGTVNFASNYSSLPGGSPIKNAVLVE
jgi:hypothetical protein